MQYLTERVSVRIIRQQKKQRQIMIKFIMNIKSIMMLQQKIKVLHGGIRTILWIRNLLY